MKLSVAALRIVGADRVAYNVYNRVVRPMRLRALSRSTGITIDTEQLLTIRRDDVQILLRAAHSALVEDLVRNFDYYAGAVVLPPALPGQLRTIDYSKPATHALRVGNDAVDFEFSSIPETYESVQLYLDYGKLKPDAVVLDLGGYCGVTAYAFSKAIGAKGRVVVVEADENNHGALMKNIARHELTNVEVVQAAVWSHDDGISFNAEGSMGSAATDVLSRNVAVKQVRSVTLDSLVKTHKLDRLDFIKIDIEGAESVLFAQEATGALLQRFRPKLIIEAHLIDGVMNTDSLRKALDGFGYRSEIVTQGDLPLPLIYAEPKPRS